jgi:hypothetical protein
MHSGPIKVLCGLEKVIENNVMTYFGVLCGFEGWGWKSSRLIRCTNWNRTDEWEWCNDLIWGALWIGTEENNCCHEQNWSYVWTGKYVTGRFHGQFEVICGLGLMIDDHVWPYLMWYVDRNRW